MELTINNRFAKVKAIIKEIAYDIVTMIVVGLLMFSFLRFVAGPVVVDGSSMSYTLTDNDYLIVNKIGYRITEPKRFDIISFKQDTNTYYIKRIIGLPGETVTIDYSGAIKIDGKVLDEDFGIEAIINPGTAIEPITLGEDEYFVLGDNRNHSIDSRYKEVGLVNKDQIMGKACCRIAPFNKVGPID